MLSERTYRLGLPRRRDPTSIKFQPFRGSLAVIHECCIHNPVLFAAPLPYMYRPSTVHERRSECTETDEKTLDSRDCAALSRLCDKQPVGAYSRAVLKCQYGVWTPTRACDATRSGARGGRPLPLAQPTTGAILLLVLYGPSTRTHPGLRQCSRPYPQLRLPLQSQSHNNRAST